MSSGYVPPYKRKEQAASAVTKTVSMTSWNDFPDLNTGPKTAKVWGKTTFSQKIKDLIVNEQKTEAEREAEAEAARAIYGYVILDIRPFTKEKYILFNERMLGIETEQNFQITNIENFKRIIDGINPAEPVEPIIIPQPNFNNESLVELESKTSEEDVGEESEDVSEEYESPEESYEEETYDEYY
jgi:hypothetical protein